MAFYNISTITKSNRNSGTVGVGFWNADSLYDALDYWIQH
jgi:hypothetical protein